MPYVTLRERRIFDLIDLYGYDVYLTKVVIVTNELGRYVPRKWLENELWYIKDKVAVRVLDAFDPKFNLGIDQQHFEIIVDYKLDKNQVIFYKGLELMIVEKPFRLGS